VKNHGAKAGETLLHRLRDSINQRGTLDVLRQGIEMLGVKGKLPLAQFKPALALNPEIQARYQANRLRVVRQVRYSQHNENSIDIVLFLNGLAGYALARAAGASRPASLAAATTAGTMLYAVHELGAGRFSQVSTLLRVAAIAARTADPACLGSL
jgi:hypothetical protein